MSISKIAELPGHTDRGKSTDFQLNSVLDPTHPRYHLPFPAWHISWSPSTPILASCSSDKSVRLYNYNKNSSPSPSPPSPYSFQYQSSIPTSHQRTVRSLAFSPTGATLATASFDSTVGIWQQTDEAGVDDGELSGDGAGGGGRADGEWEAVDPLEGHESECKSAEWSFDGRLLASCSRDKSVWIWEGKRAPHRFVRGSATATLRSLTRPPARPRSRRPVRV